MKPELVQYIQNYTNEIEIAFQRKYRLMKMVKDIKEDKKKMDKRNRKLVELFVMSNIYDTFLNEELFPSTSLTGEDMERAKENEKIAALLLYEIDRATKKIGTTRADRKLMEEENIGIGFAPIYTNSNPGKLYIDRVYDFGTDEMSKSVRMAIVDSDSLEYFNRYINWTEGWARTKGITWDDPELNGKKRALLKDHEYIAKLLRASPADMERLIIFKSEMGEFLDRGEERKPSSDPSTYPAFLVDVYHAILDKKRIGADDAEAILSDELRTKHNINDDDWNKYKPIMAARLTGSQEELDRVLYIDAIVDVTVQRMIKYLGDIGWPNEGNVSKFIVDSTSDIKSAVAANRPNKIGDNLISREELLQIFTNHSQKKGYGIRGLSKLNLEDDQLKALADATFYQDRFKGQSTSYETEFDEIISSGMKSDQARRGDKCKGQRAKLEDVKTTFDEIEKGARYGVIDRKFEKDMLTLQRMKTKTAELERMNEIIGEKIDEVHWDEEDFAVF